MDLEFVKFSLIFYGPLLAAVSLALLSKRPLRWGLLTSVFWALLCVPSVFLLIMGHAFQPFRMSLSTALISWVGTGFVIIWIPALLVHRSKGREGMQTGEKSM